MKKRFIGFIFALIVSLIMLSLGLSANGEELTFTPIEGTSGADSEFGYENLFDGDTSTKWYLKVGSYDQEKGEYAQVIFEASEPVVVTGLTFTTCDDTETYPDRNPLEYTFYGCNDYGNASEPGWIRLGGDVLYEKMPTTALTDYNVAITTVDAYTHFKLELIMNMDGDAIQLSELKVATDKPICEHEWVDNGITGDCRTGTFLKQICAKCAAEKQIQIKSEHEFDQSGVCSLCRIHAAASVNDTFYVHFDEAFAEASAKADSTLKLYSDVAFYEDGYLNVSSGRFTLDLNGCKMTAAENIRVIAVSGDAALTIINSSDTDAVISYEGMESDGYAIIAEDQTGTDRLLTIGSKSDPSDNNIIISAANVTDPGRAILANNAEVAIYGGMFIGGIRLENTARSLAELTDAGYTLSEKRDGGTIETVGSTDSGRKTLYVVLHTHAINEEAGKCDCGFGYQAGVRDAGGIRYYDTLKEALASVESSSDPSTTVYLYEDFKINGYDEVLTIRSGKFTLELNGHTIDGTGTDNPLLSIREASDETTEVTVSNGTLTNDAYITLMISQNASVALNELTVRTTDTDSNSSALYIGSAETVMINNGNYDAAGGCAFFVESIKNSKTRIQINGAAFKSVKRPALNVHSGTLEITDLTAASDNYSMLVGQNTVKLTVSGGRFDSGITVYKSDWLLGDILADGYTFSDSDSEGSTLGNIYSAAETGKIPVYVKAHTHELSGDKCTCGLTYFASVTANGVENKYFDLSKAFEAVGTSSDKGTVLKLLENVKLKNSAVIVTSGIFTVDLNGNTLSNTAGAVFEFNAASGSTVDVTMINSSSELGKLDCGFVVGDNATIKVIGEDSRLTIDGGDSNNIKVGNLGQTDTVIVDSGKLTLLGGDIESTVTGMSAVRVKNNGKVTISGGVINGHYSVRVDASAPNALTLNGGTYKGMLELENGEEIASQLADGYICSLNRETAEYINAYVSSISNYGEIYVIAHTHVLDANHACACGFVCAHRNLDDGNYCTDCKTQFKAMLIVGETVTLYDDFIKALEAAEGSVGADICVKLLDNIELADSSISLKKGVFTLDLNGKQIASNDKTIRLCDADTVAQYTLDLTIINSDSINSGKIISKKGAAVIVDNSNVTSLLTFGRADGSDCNFELVGSSEGLIANGRTVIWGGTFASGSYSLYVSGGGDVAVHGGDFKSKIYLYPFGGKLKLSGGEFAGAYAGKKISELIADGYALAINGSVVDPDERSTSSSGYYNSLSEKFNIVPHTHSHDENGKCMCGDRMAAKVVSEDGSVTFYKTVYEAFECVSRNSVLKVLDDCRFEGAKNFIGADFTLDLNGKTLTLGDGSAESKLAFGGYHENFTVTDSAGDGGIVCAAESYISVENCTLNIESGKFDIDLRVSEQSGALVLSGGSFTNLTINQAVRIAEGYVFRKDDGEWITPSIGEVYDNFSVVEVPVKSIAVKINGIAAVGNYKSYIMQTLDFTVDYTTDDSDGEVTVEWLKNGTAFNGKLTNGSVPESSKLICKVIKNGYVLSTEIALTVEKPYRITVYPTGGMMTYGETQLPEGLAGLTVELAEGYRAAAKWITSYKDTVLTDEKTLISGESCGGFEFVTALDASDSYYGIYALVNIFDENGSFVTKEEVYSSLKVNKAASSVVTVPDAIGGLIYNSSEQALVSGGAAEGGKFVYSLYENGSYTENLPHGKDAEKYTVWYKVSGDKNHYDSAPSSIETVIFEATITLSPTSGQAKVYNTDDPGFAYTLDGIFLPESAALDGTLGRESGENVGRYAFTIGTLKLTDNSESGFKASNYKLVLSGNSYFEITPAEPIYTLPSAVEATFGDTLEKVALPAGWSWMDPNISVGDVRTSPNKFAAKYDPRDPNYKLTENIEISVIVNPLDITDSLTVMPIGDQIYDGGKALTPELNVMYRELKLVRGTDYSVEYDKNTSVGAADVTVSAVNGSNYIFGKTKASFKINKAIPDYTVPSGIRTEYGIGKTLGEVALPEGWSWVDGTVLLGDASDIAKQFKADFTPSDTQNYETIKDKNVSVTVIPKQIEADAANIKSVIYSGKAQTPAVEVSIRGEGLKLEAVRDYSVSYGANTDVGYGTAIVEPVTNGNYAFDPLTCRFEIAPAKVALTGVKIADKLYDGNTSAIVSDSGSLLGKLDGTELGYTVTAEFEDWNAADGKLVKLKLTLNGSDASNYIISEDSQSSAEAAIKKAKLNAPSVSETDVKNGWQGVYKVALPSLPELDAGLEYGDIVYGVPNASILDGYTISDEKLIDSGEVKYLEFEVDAKKASTLGKIGKLTVIVSSTNYEDIALSVDINGTDRTAPAMTLTPSKTVLYGGGKLKLTLERGNLPDDAEITVIGTDSAGKNIGLVKDGNIYTADLPNRTLDYTFKAIYDGSFIYDSEVVIAEVGVSYKSTTVIVPTRPIELPEDLENGNITSDADKAKVGETVTITVEPDAGYEIKDIIVTDKNGNALELTERGEGKYSFRMPSGGVNINASFKKTADTVDEELFDDIPAGAYYFEAVSWAVKNKVTNGIGNGKFGPELACTRAQIVTFLWRAAGSPESGKRGVFSDVASEAYYAEAAAWAFEKGITNGIENELFGPELLCTRAQAVTFLWRAAGSPEPKNACGFADVPSDVYYAEAAAWAFEKGITNGITNELFDPNGICTRAQIVTFLCRAYN